MSKGIRFIALVCLWGPWTQALADKELIDWQVHGFLSQGYILTEGNDFFGSSRDGGSFDFTEVGLNVSLRPWNRLLVSAQGLFRQAGASDEEGVRLDFAQLDYYVPLGETSTLGIRLGRVKNPFGLYNDTRDVVWTRPGVLLPQSVYFDSLALRQAMISSDGGLLYGRYAHGDHAISTEFLVADPLDETGGAAEFLTGIPDVQGDLNGRPMLIGRATYEWLAGRFRLMFSIVDLDRDFHSSTLGVSSGTLTTQYPLASMQYNAENWTLTAEYGRVITERSGFTPGGDTLKNTSESFYVQGQYRLNPKWSLLARYDVFFANVDDRDGRETSKLTGLPRHRFFARDLTVGARWELARHWLLVGEYHYIDGTAWASEKDNPELRSGGGDRYWHLFTLMASFRF
ncbi:MAG: hypothetical protein JXR29_12070 [Methylothermaceae bacterium]|nr:hypothetical protein [Methylothermaceae bacterium]